MSSLTKILILFQTIRLVTSSDLSSAYPLAFTYLGKKVKCKKGKSQFSPGGDQVSIGLDLGERYGKVALMLGDLMDRKNVTTRHTGINYKVFLHMLGGRLPGVSRFNYLE